MCFKKVSIGTVVCLFVVLLQHTAIAQNIHADMATALIPTH